MTGLILFAYCTYDTNYIFFILIKKEDNNKTQKIKRTHNIIIEHY